MPKPPTSPGTRASLRSKSSRRLRTNAIGEPETPRTRAKRKWKTARAKANAAAKRVKPFTAAVLNPPDPVEKAVKTPKKLLVQETRGKR